MIAHIRRASAAVRRFWLQPAPPLPLAVLRIGLGLLLMIQAIAIAPRALDLYGPSGLVQWEAAHELIPPAAPRLSWAVGVLSAAGLTAPESIRLLLAIHGLAAVGLLLGWMSRSCAVIAWATHLLVIVSNDATVYGAVEFINIALFYCCLLPVGATLSVDRMLGREGGQPSADARVGVRILQLHMIVVYASSGFEKATGAQWWNGEAIWRALMRTDMATADFSWLSGIPWIATLAAWSTLALEIGYAFWIWPLKSRRYWAAAIVMLHLGIALTMGLHLFAAVMILLNVCAWIIPSDATESLTSTAPQRRSSKSHRPLGHGPSNEERPARLELRGARRGEHPIPRNAPALHI